MGGNDHRQLGAASVSPVGGGGLGVEIDNQGIEIVLRRGYREMKGKSGFSCTAFLGEDCDCFQGAKPGKRGTYERVNIRKLAHVKLCTL